MQKNKTYWIILLFISILLLDLLILYFIYNKKPMPYIITQHTATPLTMNADVSNNQIPDKFYYYTQSADKIKFYNLEGDLLLEKDGQYKVFRTLESSNKYLISSNKSLFIVDLEKKEMDEILIANSEIKSATASNDNKFINYSIEIKDKAEIWQYDIQSKASKLLTSVPLASGLNLYLLGWSK